MNKYINKSISGLFMGTGIAIALGISSFVFDKLNSDDDKYKRINLDHSKVELSEGRLTKYGRSPMINVKVSNNSKFKIDTIAISAELYDDKGRYGLCLNFTDSFEKNETREILIECHDYDSHKIPENTTFKVKIKSAQLTP